MSRRRKKRSAIDLENFIEIARRSGVRKILIVPDKEPTRVTLGNNHENKYVIEISAGETHLRLVCSEPLGRDHEKKPQPYINWAVGLIKERLKADLPKAELEIIM
jgi:hypothetical protein